MAFICGKQTGAQMQAARVGGFGNQQVN
jgi:hypothetical protein